jgi:hypothetical protein
MLGRFGGDSSWHCSQSPQRGEDSLRWTQKAYREVRSSVERFFGWLKKGFEGSRFGTKGSFPLLQGFVYLACFFIVWRILI